MKRLRTMVTSRAGRVLLQLATLLFFANATTAFGACCIADLSTDDNAPAVEMPCHKKSDDNSDHSSDETSDPDRCCAMCVQMMFVGEVRFDNVLTRTVAPIGPMLFRAAHGIDSPFRPPIPHLS